MPPDKDRNIPAIRLLATGNLVQLGYGARSRRIWTAETDRTSAIAEGISRDKDLTKSCSASCGVPVPEGYRLVDSAEDAWDAAEDIGLPVVVKPVDGNHARGVFTNLMTREEVESAYAAPSMKAAASSSNATSPARNTACWSSAASWSPPPAARPPRSSATANRPSRELIDSQINSDPRRGADRGIPARHHLADRQSGCPARTQRQGLERRFDPGSRSRSPDRAQRQPHRRHHRRSSPRHRGHRSLAARIVGLDIAGVDLVCEDISKPLDEQGGAIVEVNAGPSLLMHLKPESGKPRPVGRAIVDQLFPNGDDGRIPVIGVSGSFGKTTVASLIARFLALSGKHTGLACSDGLFLDRDAASPRATTPTGARPTAS
jgi:cyanophycin synthetase